MTIIFQNNLLSQKQKKSICLKLERANINNLEQYMYLDITQDIRWIDRQNSVYGRFTLSLSISKQY